MPKPVELECSLNHDAEPARAIPDLRREGLSRRLLHWRDGQLLRRALQRAGEPGLVLDLPCGSGRFWPLLLEKANRVVIAADSCEQRLAVACAAQPVELTRRVKPLQTSIFAIDLPGNAVDSIFCMRLLPYLTDVEARQAMLREFHRVTRDSVILSLWVDGNYKAWKRRRLEQHRQAQGDSEGTQSRGVVSRALIEKEFVAAGFRIDTHYDFLPGYAMWRIYVLCKN